MGITRGLLFASVALVSLLAACAGAPAQDPAQGSRSPMELELDCDLNAYVEEPGTTGPDAAAALQARLDQWRIDGVSLTAREYAGDDAGDGLVVYLLFQDSKPWGTLDVQATGGAYLARAARRCDG